MRKGKVMKKPSEYIAEMADLLQSEGWVQGELHNANGSCLLGAMVVINLRDMSASNMEVSRAARLFMEDKISGKGGLGIACWNDTPGRTFNEVLDLLHECQIGLKEQEC